MIQKTKLFVELKVDPHIRATYGNKLPIMERCIHLTNKTTSRLGKAHVG